MLGEEENSCAAGLDDQLQLSRVNLIDQWLDCGQMEEKCYPFMLGEGIKCHAVHEYTHLLVENKTKYSI